MLFQKHRRLRCRRKADRQYLPAEPLDLRLTFRHLAEVRPAGQSGEMAEEDEDQRLGVEIGEPGGRAVESLEDAIGDSHLRLKRHDEFESMFPRPVAG